MPWSSLRVCTTLPGLGALFLPQTWSALQVGHASSLGSGSALPSRRSKPQFQPQFQLQSLRQSLTSLNGSGDTRPGWDPEPLHQCHRGDLGGLAPPREPGLPRGPIHQIRGSPHPLGPSRHLLQQQRRPHRLSYPQPRGSGGPYSSGILSRGMSGSTLGIFMGSRITTFRR